MQESPPLLSVEEIYRDSHIDDARFDAVLERSLQPRAAPMLYDKMGELGLQEASMLLDIGCRDARHTCELVQRFGATALGIDPVADHIQRARHLITERQLAERVTVMKGQIESIPTPAQRFDYIWCRDVLNHVPNLRAGLGECVRVLKPGGYILIYQTFATALLEPPEAARLYPPLAINPTNMSPTYVEEVSRRAGFELVEKDVIGSEWREAWEEDGTRTTSTQLLRIARLRRKRQAYIAEFGRTLYEVELANCYWGVYQMLGKLCPTCYVLRKPE
ncbi:MAG: class I SAM-dependent methyltransferase [Caldilineaceae bacterium]